MTIQHSGWVPARCSTKMGVDVSLSCPDPFDIHIYDIGHALAHTCRWGGHTKQFYSVAEHCVHMSNLVHPDVAFEALMHDAAEAYIGDIPTPLKQLVPEIKAVEKVIFDAIERKFEFRLAGFEAAVVKDADLRMARTEADQLMHPLAGAFDDLEGSEPFNVTLPCWSPDKARHEFLERFRVLYYSLEKTA